MARNNISLSCDELPGGKYKVRWREDVVVDGVRTTKARSRTVTDKGARDELVAKLRRTLETGAVFEPEARIVTTAANLELAARVLSDLQPQSRSARPTARSAQ